MLVGDAGHIITLIIYVGHQWCHVFSVVGQRCWSIVVWVTDVDRLCWSVMLISDVGL